MKKKKNLKLFLNKEKISELSKANQQKIVGGYPTEQGCTGGGGGSYEPTACLNSCSCTVDTVGQCA